MRPDFLDKVLVIVPTKGRTATIFQDTLRWLPQCQLNYMVICEMEEQFVYSDKLGPLHTMILPESNKGLGYSLSKAKEFAEQAGYKYIFKLDDDIKNWIGQTRRSGNSDSVVEFTRTMCDIIEALEKREEVGGIGFVYRNQMFQLRKWVMMDYPFRTAYCVRTELFRPEVGISDFEDFYASLVIYGEGKHTLTYGLAGIDCKEVGKFEGGLQCFNRDEQSRRSAAIIMQKYPKMQFKRVEGRAWKIEPDFSNMVKAKKLY
jgi:hypothetical protein